MGGVRIGQAMSPIAGKKTLRKQPRRSSGKKVMPVTTQGPPDGQPHRDRAIAAGVFAGFQRKHRQHQKQTQHAQAVDDDQ